MSPQSEPLDHAALARLCAWGGEDLLRRIVAAFLEHAPAVLRAARAGLEGDDPTAVGAAAHSLKSSAAQVGAVRLSQVAAAIEELARAGAVAPLADRVAAMEHEFAAVRPLLEKAAGGQP
jgi:HPt (histidine-containing phosphotransfer) domain-containing protein